MLVNMSKLLADAQKGDYAVGSFSVANMEMVLGVLKAAKELKAPVILQIAEVRLKQSPLEIIGPLMVAAAKSAGTPVAVHFDHGKTIEKIAQALELGFTSVMFDGSHLPLDENIKTTKEVIALAKKYGADVEAASVSFEGAGIKISGTLEDNRASYVDRYNDILTQIDQLAKDAGYKGVNLLGGTDQSLTVVFNEDRSSSLTIQGVDGSASGLGLTPETDWSTNAGIDAALTKIDSAISSLRSMSSEFGNNYSVVQTREEFTENLINVLEEGSDKLTLADMNEESANMLALQTRQQLAINSLSLASQAAQSVLKLF